MSLVTYINDIFRQLISDITFGALLFLGLIKNLNCLFTSEPFYNENFFPTCLYSWFGQNKARSIYFTFLNSLTCLSRVSLGKLLIETCNSVIIFKMNCFVTIRVTELEELDQVDAY